MRIYIVMTRNDLEDNILQLLDVKPNVSQRSDLDPPGQTQYLNKAATSLACTLTDSGGGVWVMDDVVGALVPGAPAGAVNLYPYLIDNVENVGGGNLALTVAQATEIVDDILADCVAGTTDLDLARINVHINAATAVSGSDLDGAGGGSSSTGSVEDVMRILSGENYFVAAGAAVSGGANAFAAAPVGYFTTAPNVESADSVRSSVGPVRGKSPFHGPFHRPAAPVQTGTESVLYQEPRFLVEGGSVNLSELSGNLSVVTSANFQFLNPALVYGAGGTAAYIDGTAIPLTGLGRAFTIYKSDGSVL